MLVTLKMIKTKLRLSLLFVVLCTLLMSNLALADWSDTTLGNNQYYSIYFDEEGEAMVVAKLEFQNTGQEDLNIIEIEIPGQVELLNTLQEVEYEVESEGSWQGYYTDYKYYSLDPEIDQGSDSATLTFELSEVVSEQEQAVIILYYKVYGYVEEDWGVFDFDFETIKSDVNVEYVRVSVNVVNNLFLKDVGSEIDYVKTYATVDSLDVEMANEAIYSENLEDYSRSIERQSGQIETSNALDPNENLIVSGSYSKYQILLNIWKVVAGIFAVLAIIGFVIYSLTSLNIRKKQKGKEVLISGFLSGLSLVLVFGLSSYVINNLRTWVGYTIDGPITAIIFLIALIFSVAALVLPPIYLGFRHKNALIGILAAGAIVGFMTLIGTITLILFLVF